MACLVASATCWRREACHGILRATFPDNGTKAEQVLLTFARAWPFDTNFKRESMSAWIETTNCLPTLSAITGGGRPDAFNDFLAGQWEVRQQGGDRATNKTWLAVAEYFGRQRVAVADVSQLVKNKNALCGEEGVVEDSGRTRRKSVCTRSSLPISGCFYTAIMHLSLRKWGLVLPGMAPLHFPVESNAC